MKTIDTLVEDIYGLFSSEFTPSVQDTRVFGQKLADHLVTRIGERRDGHYLRLSNVGVPCERKLWYTINTPSYAESLPPATRIKFLIGDICEELLLFLAAQAGHKVEDEQAEVSVAGVKGHIDAVIDGVVTDCKSAASQSFKKFESHTLVDDDPFGYITQLGSYREAKGTNEAAFLVIDKQLGKLTLDKHPNDGVSYERVVEEKKAVVALPEPPERPYEPKPDGKSGNMKLGTVCSYCQFKNHCWDDANDGHGLRTFIYSTGPRYLTHVAREPDVLEVDYNNVVKEKTYVNSQT